ncbi:hypothetical protein IW262DRAFT_1296666 [Armillaria fumosa]|nr:hypothetical protein IW262DRAFT_1296666 [Armillaria fumosa]
MTEPVPTNPLFATMTPFDNINPDLFEDASFGHAYFGMTAMEADREDYDSLLGRPSSSEEVVSFPFSRIDHGHAEMDINPLFHGLEMAPFQEPHLLQLPFLPESPVDLPQSPQCPHDTKDLEATDKSIMQRNSPKLEDRSKDGMEGGAPGKGQMGAIASWPAVLTVWLLNQHYNIYLGIPATFSTDLLAWWNTLQPGWCHSDTGPLPLKDYSRVLNKALCKGGPNGIVTMLIGLMWWDQGILSTEEATLWKAMVADVRACIHALTPSLVEWIDVDLGTKARRTLTGVLVALVDVEGSTFVSKRFRMADRRLWEQCFNISLLCMPGCGGAWKYGAYLAAKEYGV